MEQAPQFRSRTDGAIGRFNEALGLTHRTETAVSQFRSAAGMMNEALGRGHGGEGHLAQSIGTMGSQVVVNFRVELPFLEDVMS